jgi:hypothetical protein
MSDSRKAGWVRRNPLAAAVVSSAGVVGAEFEDGIAVAATPGLGLGPRAAAVGLEVELEEAETLRRGRGWATGLCRAAAAAVPLLASHIRCLLRYALSADFRCLFSKNGFHRALGSAQLSCGICVESLMIMRQ